jgi:hypothetical protein
MTANNSQKQSGWLNRTVLGVGLTSLFSDWSHETATAVLPAFLSAIGAGPVWLGVIEGVADGLSSFAKLAAGHYTDQLKRRKPLAVFGYAFTAIATASFGIATHAVHVLIGRSAAWLGRGVRSPAKKALLAADVPDGAYGRAFGLERLMETLGDPGAIDGVVDSAGHRPFVSNSFSLHAVAWTDRGCVLLAAGARTASRGERTKIFFAGITCAASGIPDFCWRWEFSVREIFRIHC